MKAHTGFIELVIMMAMMVACVPLLCTLVVTCDRTKMNYLEDKTIYKMSDSVEWDKSVVNGKTVLVPSTLAPIGIDYGGAQIIALVNDDYCPDDGKIIRYNYDADSVNSPFNDTTDAKLEITDGWKAQYSIYWGNQLGDSDYASSLYNPHVNAITGEADELCIVWNTANKCWMIAKKDVNKIINIYE